MKAAAREQHYQDAQGKCKPKRKRNKPAQKAEAAGNPPIPPSPQRVSKKEKGGKMEEGAPADAGHGNEVKADEGSEVPEAETKKGKSKRPEPEKVKEAWVAKEWPREGETW